MKQGPIDNRSAIRIAARKNDSHSFLLGFLRDEDIEPYERLVERIISQLPEERRRNALTTREHERILEHVRSVLSPTDYRLLFEYRESQDIHAEARREAAFRIGVAHGMQRASAATKAVA
jgi:hypothetical protein